MAEMTRLTWLSSALQFQGSILLRILARMAVFCGISLVTVVTYQQGLWVYSDQLQALTGNVAFNLVLGLLLVFRMSTAYDRFLEGRKVWETLVITIRNLAREIQIAINAPTQKAKAGKVKALNWLMSFAIALKCQLRHESPITPLATRLDEGELTQLEAAKHPPQLITFWLSNYLKQQQNSGHIEIHQRLAISGQLDSLIEVLCGCERIAAMPVPLSYGIYLRRLTLLYCFLLPWGLVGQLGWATPAAIALISFVLLGVEEIGNAIEDPFGNDLNDFSLEAICDGLLSDIESILAFGSANRSVAEPIRSVGNRMGLANAAKPPAARVSKAKVPEGQPSVTKVPEVKVPEVKAPVARVSEVKAPVARAPEVRAPAARTPELRAPEVRAPEVRAPAARPSQDKSFRTQPPQAKSLRAKSLKAKPSRTEPSLPKLTPRS